MKTPLNYFLTAFLSILPLDSYAFPEIPFCPAGGPPGWLNHFNYKRDQNIWRLQQRRYQYNTPYRYVNDYYSPSYGPRIWHKLENPDGYGYTIPPSTPNQHKRRE
jgi:hypothetical protein